ncbi:hypothetical protein D3C72_2583830 [compost metagenome]
MNRQLLDRPVHWRGETHQAVALFGFLQFLGEGRGGLVGLMLQVEHRAAGLGDDALPGALGFSSGSDQLL